MGTLNAFLKENAVQEENIKYPASKRFADEQGNPMEWEICAITSNEDDQIRTSCTRKVPVPGKKNMFQPECDFPKYLGKLAARCTVFPNLNSADLQNSYGVMGDDSLLKTMLKPGEYAEYLNKVQAINGFDVGMPELVEEAKN
jgi:hypothetical protein